MRDEDFFREVLSRYAKLKNYRKVGDALGVSRQYIFTILTKARAAGQAPPAEKRPKRTRADYMKDKRQQRIDAGMCPYHVDRRRAFGYVVCEECVEAQRERGRLKRERAAKKKKASAKKAGAKKSTRKKSN